MGRPQDLGVTGNVVTGGPWSMRDAYVAETAVALDRLEAKIERLERREEMLAKRVEELTDHAEQTTRFQALAESLRNARDYKLDEVFRLVRDVRGRVDAMEGPRAAFNALNHKTFASVDRTLAELSAARVETGFGSRPPSGLTVAFLAVAALASLAGVVFL